MSDLKLMSQMLIFYLDLVLMGKLYDDLTMGRWENVIKSKQVQKMSLLGFLECRHVSYYDKGGDFSQ